MIIGELSWPWRISMVALFCATLPLGAGMVPLSAANAAVTDTGFYEGGTILNVSITGTVALAEQLVAMNPDGSLASVPSVFCGSCWSIGYQYFVPGGAYPTDAGGDGQNHFAGGGGNWDLFPSPGFNRWAAQGKITTDTTDPDAIRFGAVAGTWRSTPVPNSADWFFVGYGGNLTVPAGGAHLKLVVVDSFYSNNSSGFSADVTAVPEPSAAWLVFAGVVFFARLCRVRQMPLT